MKYALRRKNHVQLLDMISLDMIDESWLERFPTRLRSRLKELLNDPNGKQQLSYMSWRRFQSNAERVAQINSVN